jgi:hypothetical protein
MSAVIGHDDLSIDHIKLTLGLPARFLQAAEKRMFSSIQFRTLMD